MTFFHYIYDEEIGDRAFDYLLSLCDSVEMLYAYRREYADDFEITALCTEYEGLIPAIIGVRKGESWGMEGRIYKFAITEEIKKVIAEKGLDLEIRFLDFLSLENLTLYSGDKVMFSVCSHEGYDTIDEDFKNKVSDFCRREIVKTKLYAETLERYKKLPARTLNERAVIRSKLYDLVAQVENAWGKVIRAVPRWEGLTYEEYLSYAKPVFSPDVFEQLERAGSFKGLQPAGYPRTFGEMKAFRNVREFGRSELMHKIEKQLDMLETVFFIEDGFDNWHMDGEEEGMPSLIINKDEED